MTMAQAPGISHRPIRSRVFFLRLLIKCLGLVCCLLIGTSEATTAKQQVQRKGASKATQTRKPAQKLTKSHTHDALLPQPAPQIIELQERRDLRVYRTRSRETLSQLLSRFGVSVSERQYWATSVRRNLGSEVLPAGREIHLYFAPPKFISRGKVGLGQLQALEVDLNDVSTLTIEKGIHSIHIQKHEKPVDVELKTVSGSVAESLFADGQRAGVNKTLLSQLADIFTWDIDLEKDIHPGDSFKILYEQRSRTGHQSKPALRIMAAELMSAGQKYTAIYFEKQKGLGNYYDMDGRSLARTFLRFPLEFTSITSLFTESRFHPLLKTTLPHTGVDFAAKRGTPVRAVGDGMIAEAGWNGAYGKAIDIKHDANYTSRYAHLQSFAPGIRPGTTVTKGQVIGYVGSTGRSTGPHLHFELYKDQQYLNPLGVDYPAEDSIEPALLRIFENQKRTFLVELTSLPQT